MEQKIPSISDRDIRRIIRRDFPQFKFTEIENMLKMYKFGSKKGKNRVYASILKLSDGKIELIKKYVEKANIDYRDIIALSEYPNYSEHAFENDLPVEKKKHLLMMTGNIMRFGLIKNKGNPNCSVTEIN